MSSRLSFLKNKDMRKALVQYFFPPVCSVCGRVLVDGKNCDPKLLRIGICRPCLSRMPVRLKEERICPCLSDPYDDDPIPDLSVWVLFHYETPVTSMLRRLKFQDGEYCGILLGELAGREILFDLPFVPDAVVPIPLSKKRKEKRGYNQAAVIGERIAALLHVPLLEDVLVRTRHTKQQSRFNDPLVRSKNVEGAFALSEDWDVQGLSILIVDDILTSGATIHEAAKVLHNAGVKEVMGAVCASHRTLPENTVGKETEKSMNCH